MYTKLINWKDHLSTSPVVKKKPQLKALKSAINWFVDEMKVELSDAEKDALTALDNQEVITSDNSKILYSMLNNSDLSGIAHSRIRKKAVEEARATVLGAASDKGFLAVIDLEMTCDDKNDGVYHPARKASSFR
jgi:hypothetical protein